MQPDYVRLTLEFYRQITGDYSARELADIPPKTMIFIAPMEVSELAKPVVIAALRNGADASPLAELYGLDRKQVLRWQRKYLPGKAIRKYG